MPPDSVNERTLGGVTTVHTQADTQARQSRYWRWLRDALLLAAVLFAVHLYQTRDAVVGRAPLLQGVDLDGTPRALADFHGRPVLVYFWATWCPVCRAEQGTIRSIAADYPVLSVALEDTAPAALRAYMEEHELDFAVLRDTDGELAQRYGVRGVPAFFVIDGAGMIRSTAAGYTTGPGLRLRLWWAGRAAVRGARVVRAAAP